MAADVGVTLLAPEFAAPDTDLAYAIAIQNGGPDPADTATLTDTLPGDLTFVSLTQTSGPAFACSTPSAGAGGTVSCANPSMAAGAGAGFTLVVHVPAVPSDAQPTNTAGVSWAGHDPTVENDVASTATTISDANLAATASGPAGVVAGASITYTLGLSNVGPDPGIGSTLSDTLPDHTRFVSLTQTSGAAFVLSTPAPGAAGTVTASRAFMDSGSSAQFTLVLAVDLDTLGGTAIAHTVTASAQAGDRDMTDNSATGSTTAAPAAPDVTAVTPGRGLPGTAVGIDGARLGQATTVIFGDVAGSFTIDGSSHITAVAPAGVSGTVDVRVGNDNRTQRRVVVGGFTLTTAPAAAPVAAVAPVAGRKLICGRVPDLRRHTLRGGAPDPLARPLPHLASLHGPRAAPAVARPAPVREARNRALRRRPAQRAVALSCRSALRDRRVLGHELALAAVRREAHDDDAAGLQADHHAVAEAAWMTSSPIRYSALGAVRARARPTTSRRGRGVLRRHGAPIACSAPSRSVRSGGISLRKRLGSP